VSEPCHPTLRSLNAGVCPLCDAAPDPLAAELAVLDEEEARARKELAELDRDAALLSLAEFVKQGWHVLEPVELEWNWHHDALCANIQGMLDEWLRIRELRETLRAKRERQIWKQRWQKLIVNICPSSLKSRIIMVFAVAWMWLRCASWTVLCVSANPENVRRDAEACRDLITSAWYRDTFGITWAPREDIDAKSKFQTTAGGQRISRGIGGKFTGIHVDAIFLDDPDDATDVHSEAERRKRSAKMRALSSRLNDKRHFVMLLVQQRVHIDDASGEQLDKGGWLHAQYPTHYRADKRRDSPFYTDPRTIEGENLHPERFTPEVIAAAKLELGSQGYDAQYECDPAPADGVMFKTGWFRYFRIAGEPLGGARRVASAWSGECEIVERYSDGKLVLDWLAVSADCTFGSLSDTASAVSLQVIGGRGPKRFVFLDRTRPMTYPETRDQISALILEWSQRVRCGVSVLVERKANGQAVIDELSIVFSGLIAIDPEGGKVARAAAMSPAIESGCVYVLEGAEWVEPYITEIVAFPFARRDDRVDGLSQTMHHYRADLDAMRLEAKNAALLSLRRGLHPGQWRGIAP
jgi:predicted phage terminase large subunit-like protein